MLPPRRKFWARTARILCSSEDPVQDKNRAEAFATKAKEKNSIEIEKNSPNTAILLVGNDDFRFPFRS